MLFFDITTTKQLSRRQVAKRLYPTNLPANPTPDQLAPYGVEPIRKTERPTHEPWQMVHEADPVDTDNDGVREQQWVVEDRPLVEVIATRVREVEQQYATILNGGFVYDFGSKTATLPDGTTEAAGVRTLQTRPTDRERWQATMQVAQQYVMAGMPTEPMRPFRTADNTRVPVTAQNVADCLNAMQAKFGLALDAMWAHKDAIRQLTTVDDVIAYDITTLWP